MQAPTEKMPLKKKKRGESALKCHTYQGKYIIYIFPDMCDILMHLCIGYDEKESPKFVKVTDMTQTYVNSKHSFSAEMLT